MPADEISTLIAEAVSAAGAELVDLRVAGSPRKPQLRVFVDVPGGTTAEACAELSRRIEARLDATGLAGERYTLEVSSPGLDRPLRTRRDFQRLLGKEVVVRIPTEDGEKELVGVIEAVTGEAGEQFSIVLRSGGTGGSLRLAREQILQARAHIPW